MKYIIAIDESYYLGNTYCYQHQCFPAYGIKSKAKRYKTKGIAMRVVKTLKSNCANMYQYLILEVSE